MLLPVYDVSSHAGVGAHTTAHVACGTITNFTCLDPDGFAQSVFVNGTAATGKNYISRTDKNTGAAIGIAIINGSDQACGSTSNAYCPTRDRGNLHNTSLTIKG